MKKILVISSSPRKGGNSDLLCDEFIKGAKSSGHSVEKLFIRDNNIKYCTGCEHCFETKKCILKDDMDDIQNKMIESDIIVLSSPLYFYTMTAQLKTLIDRCCAKYTLMQNKEFYYILTAADEEKKSFTKTIEALRGFTFDCLPNATEKGMVLAGGIWHKGDIIGSKYMQIAHDLGINA